MEAQGERMERGREGKEERREGGEEGQSMGRREGKGSGDKWAGGQPTGEVSAPNWGASIWDTFLKNRKKPRKKAKKKQQTWKTNGKNEKKIKAT